MLKGDSLNSNPRKRVKLDPEADVSYNEFGGLVEEADVLELGYNQNHREAMDMKKVPEIPFPEENDRYHCIYQEIKKGMDELGDKMVKYRKLKDAQVKKEELPSDAANQKPKKVPKKGEPPKKKPANNSNWELFLATTKKQAASKPASKSESNKGKLSDSNFAAIDCEFVKCGDFDRLARVSIVNENGDCVYDSYVRPSDRITDYVTNISGITYAHLKKAPSESQVIKEIKKKLLNKIVVGHTIDKDLGICSLQGWKGIVNKIDISQVSCYKSGRKLTSLKNLAEQHLGKTIQEGWHSSVEDAQATMNLFTIRKKTILKELKII